MEPNCKEADVENTGNKKYYIVLLVLFLLLTLSTWFPSFLGLPEKGGAALLILLIGIVLWLSNLIPPAITSIIMIVLFPLFHIISFEVSVSGLGSDVVLLIIIMLCMGTAVAKTGLDRRFTFYILSKSKGSSRKTIFFVIFIAFLLTFFIPNGMARLSVLLHISLGLINTLNAEEDHNFNKSIILAITFVPWVCTVLLITGSNGAIYAASLFKSMLGFEWSYLHWFMVMFPSVVCSLIGLYGILLYLFPPKRSDLHTAQTYIKENMTKLGEIKKDELKLIALYSILILLWITKELHGMTIAMSACLVGVFIFLPGFRLITWKDAMKSVDWGIPLLFAAGFAIASAFKESGLIIWLSEIATTVLVKLPLSILAVTIMLIFVIIRIGFSHYAAMIASLLPVGLTFALATPYNPVWLGMICVVASTTAYLLPTQSIANMTTYSLGFYDTSDMAKAGSLLTILIIVLTIVFAYWYWPLVGVPINFN